MLFFYNFAQVFKKLFKFALLLKSMYIFINERKIKENGLHRNNRGLQF